MNENDTILLLRECDSGLKMAISSLDEVLDVIKNKHFKNQCIESKNKHQTLKKEIDQRFAWCDVSCCQSEWP